MIPFPKLQAVKDQAAQGVPAAELILVALYELRQAPKYVGQGEEAIYTLQAHEREETRDGSPRCSEVVELADAWQKHIEEDAYNRVYGRGVHAEREIVEEPEPDYEPQNHGGDLSDCMPGLSG